MLMHADAGGVDHLHSGIVGSSKCVHDTAPDTSPPPTDEAVIAWQARLDAYGVETDINQPSIFAEAVANDPRADMAAVARH